MSKTLSSPSDGANLNTADAQQWVLSGALTVNTVTALLKHAQGALNQGVPQTLDLSAVQQVDSAGLAWLVEMVRFCNEQNIVLQFIAVSEQLKHLASVHGVDDLIH